MNGIHLIDVLVQAGIVITGLAAAWLSIDLRETRRRWAPVAGLVGTPFWLYTTYAAGQWGVFGLSMFYTGIWAIGLRNYWWAAKTPRTDGSSA